MLSYHLDLKNRILVTTWVGEVGDEELIEFYRQIRAHPDFDLNLREIADLRLADLSKVTPDGLQRLNQLHAQHIANHSKSIKPTRAAIIASELLSFGLGRMYSAKSDEAIETKVFRDPTEPLEWLELPKDYRIDYVGHPSQPG